MGCAHAHVQRPRIFCVRSRARATPKNFLCVLTRTSNAQEFFVCAHAHMQRPRILCNAQEFCVCAHAHAERPRNLCTAVCRFQDVSLVPPPPRVTTITAFDCV